jgi:phage-related protein
MTTTVQFPTIDCTFGTPVSYAPRVLKNAYGNGYEQRVGDGLNTVAEKWTVAWQGIAWSECLAINTFLKAQKGYLPFLWTPPGEAPLQVKCESWSREKTSGTTGNVQATFEQVFDL